jgi:hypothetical protein
MVLAQKQTIDEWNRVKQSRNKSKKVVLKMYTGKKMASLKSVVGKLDVHM